MIRARVAFCLAVAAGLSAVAGCASAPAKTSASAAPKFPDYPLPDVPATLRVTADIRDRHANAWRFL